MDQTDINLGAAIRERRGKRPLASVAAAVGIDVSQLSKIERGLSRTTLGDYERIAGALGTSLAALLPDPHAAPSAPPDPAAAPRVTKSARSPKRDVKGRSQRGATR